MKNITQLKKEWSERFKPLIGRKIVWVRYMPGEEMQDADWIAPVIY